MKICHFLLLLCLPGIIWYAPLKAEISPTFSITEDYSNFSPWDLLKYETLSFDRILDFVDMIENTDNLEEIFTEAQMEEIEEFLVFLMRNGIRDWDIEAKERLEEDIAWMRGEPNNSSLADDEEEDLPYWMSSFNGYHGMKILPAVLVPSKKSEIILCKGELTTGMLPPPGGGNIAKNGKPLSQAYITAKNGGKNSGLIKQYAGRSTKEIQKSINSLEKQIVKHKDKIANPSKHCPDRNKFNPKSIIRKNMT